MWKLRLKRPINHAKMCLKNRNSYFSTIGLIWWRHQWIRPWQAAPISLKVGFFCYHECCYALPRVFTEGRLYPPEKRPRPRLMYSWPSNIAGVDVACVANSTVTLNVKLRRLGPTEGGKSSGLRSDGDCDRKQRTCLAHCHCMDCWIVELWYYVVSVLIWCPLKTCGNVGGGVLMVTCQRHQH